MNSGTDGAATTYPTDSTPARRTSRSVPPGKRRGPGPGGDTVRPHTNSDGALSRPTVASGVDVGARDTSCASSGLGLAGADRLRAHRGRPVLHGVVVQEVGDET